MPYGVVSALLNSLSNLTVISNGQLGLPLPLTHSAFSANGQYLTRKQAASISPTTCFVIARSSFNFICLLGPLGSSLALRPRYHKFVAPKKFVQMSNILQCPMILVICSASRYEQYFGWHFSLGYSTFTSKLYVNNNNRGRTDGAAAFSYSTDMKDFYVGEKNVLLSSLATSSVTIYWFSALVGAFAQLSTIFLQAQHAQILPEVRYRTVHSLCCCCYVHVYCDKTVAAMASLCCYVRYTVWCSMLIECHSGEALSYTKGHHSLVHSLPWCGIIQDSVISAGSNCEQDALGSLFSSTIQKHLVCSEGFDPGIGLLLESPCTIICLSSISIPNLIFLQEALVSRVIRYTVQNMARMLHMASNNDSKYDDGTLVALMWHIAWSAHLYRLPSISTMVAFSLEGTAITESAREGVPEAILSTQTLCPQITSSITYELQSFENVFGSAAMTVFFTAKAFVRVTAIVAVVKRKTNTQKQHLDEHSVDNTIESVAAIHKTGAHRVSNSVNSLCLGLSRWPPSTMVPALCWLLVLLCAIVFLLLPR